MPHYANMASSPDPSSPSNSTTILPKDEHGEYGGRHHVAPAKKKRSFLFWLLISLAIFIVVVLAIILPIYFTVIKKNNNNNSNADSNTGHGNDTHTDGGNTGNGTTPRPVGAITGRDGSEVTLEDGSTFTYTNQFEGFWAYDPSDPYASGGKANSWSPALNETWVYGRDRIFGYASSCPHTQSRSDWSQR